MTAKKLAVVDEAEIVADPPVASAGAADRVADAITYGIRAGTFVPGQHLLEPELTRRLAISRGSLREALKHLAAAGIVTLNRYRGAYIATLSRTAVFDLLNVLEPLARLAARLAAERCDSDEKRAEIMAAAETLDQTNRGGSRASYLEQRRRFYDTMVAMGGNGELSRVMPLPRTDLFRAQLEIVQNESQRSRHAAGYRAIARAIADGDPAGADRAVKRHFDGTRRTMAELPPAAFQEEVA